MLWVESMRREYKTNFYATFRQWQSLDAHVKKGEKGTPVVFYKPLVLAEDDEEKTIPLLRYSTLFNADQQEGWEAPQPEIKTPAQIVEAVHAYFQAVGADVRHGGSRAYYRPSEDYIQMPPMASFAGTATSTATEAYYSTLGHEHVHWTGSEKRLSRIHQGHNADFERYSFEELVAEIGAAFLCAKLGVNDEPSPDHIQYIAHWRKAFEEDVKMIFKASAKAQQAVDYLDEARKSSCDANSNPPNETYPLAVSQS